MASLSVLCLLAAWGARADEFDQIVQDAPHQTHPQSCSRMIPWADAHRSDLRAGRGLVWCAQLALADHRWGEAQALYLRVRAEYPGTQWALQSIKGLSDIALDRHQFSRAIEGYEALAKSASPFYQYVGRMGAQNAREERFRFFAVLSLSIALVLFLVGRLLRPPGLRALWPPPPELLYVAPIPAVMLLAALAQPPAEGHAVVTLALGFLALLWLNGAYLRAHPPQGAGRLVHLLLAVAQAGIFLYCAVITNGLWSKFHDTLTMGADR